MVGNFKNFKALLMLVGKIFFNYAYGSPENFLDPPPPRRQHFREKFVKLGQNPRKSWSKHDDMYTTTPNVDRWLHDVPACIVEIDVT